jgi:hypothetical protein
MMVPIFAAEGPLGPLLPRDIVLMRRQDSLPFLFGLDDPIGLDQAGSFPGIVKLHELHLHGWHDLPPARAPDSGRGQDGK